jgi:2-aminoadipate transaminase
MSDFDALFSRSARSMRFSAIRRMSALIERPGIISFAPGQPSPDTFPVEEFRDIVDEVVGRDGPATFQYILTRGFKRALEAVGGYAADKGIRSTASELLLTEGSQQALDLVSRVLLDPGDTVLVELPTYIGAISCFRAAQAEMRAVALDADGIDLDDLRRQHRAATRPKFLYVIPSFQNPAGLSHTLARRKALLEVARELDLLIVEDDPYGDLYFEDAPLPSLRSLDDSGRVVYLSSFSKILAPGLRTAFMIGPEKLLEKVEIAKQAANLCGSGLDQRILTACLERGLVDTQKAKIRPFYKRRRDVLLEALQAEMPADVTFTRPAGGMFVWLTLPEPHDTETLLEHAVAEGVAYVAGAPFCVDGSGHSSMRLTFAREDEPALREGAARLGRAVRRAEA